MHHPISFRARLSVALAAAAVSLTSCQPRKELPEGLYARLKTGRGEILLRLEAEKAPLTVANFVGLAEGTLDAAAGKRYYDGLTFHRVVKDFMIQGGDPAGNGSGGPGYRFPNETDTSLRHDGPGVLAMANSGPHTNGSQFYITHKAAPWLDGGYSVFGRVVEGQSVVDSVQPGDRIESVEILRIGSNWEGYKADQALWNSLAEARTAKLREEREAARAAETAQIDAKWPGLSEGPRGLRWKVLKEGSGPKLAHGDLARVDYQGMLTTGKTFDASRLHGGPLELEVGTGQVILGWDLTLLDMKKGERRLVVIPPELGYGPAGAGGGVIPPDAFLVFEMEVVGVR
ncbi:MAG TPA: peptidylprolyl isomerase [Spirochaetia bacterium]|nr:peptidylprolyl isomerase [Spirochaetales bacterium]HRY81101.1 peptidylprolyl isomerase [Spirochaetia bacterium]